MRLFVQRVPLSLGLVLALGASLLVVLSIGALSGYAGNVTLVVDTTSDANLTACTASPADCSLRGALSIAQNQDSIHFNIPTSDSGYNAGLGFWKIVPVTLAAPGKPLPVISKEITLDGYTQPGASVNTLGFGQGSNAQIKIQVDFVNHPGIFGIEIDTSDARVRGLAITNAGIGVSIITGSGNKVAGNFIGTDPRGNVAMGNGEGVTITTNASANTIGGSSPADKNVIVDSDFEGVLIAEPGNSVQGNLIGLGSDGTILGNKVGVAIRNTLGVNFIGGLAPGLGNVISANDFFGVDLESDSSASIVAGNLIGTNLSGQSARPNGSGGINVVGPDNVIGGDIAAARNVISGNQGAGVVVLSSGNTIKGNYIGTNAAGTSALPNPVGIRIGTFAPTNPSQNPVNNVIGGTSAAARNIISGNTADGVQLLTGDSVNNTITGNRIGTNSGGTVAVPNGVNGIIVNGASGTKIGGTANGAGNTIAFNGAVGIWVTGNGNGNEILGNFIHSNGQLGIDLGALGVDVNDVADADGGPNRLQNHPILAQAMAGSLRITGFFDSLAGNYRFEFFANDVCDASGHGEGKEFLAAVNVDLSATGGMLFETTIDVNVAPGKIITATATNLSTRDTSEFADCAEVLSTPTPTPTPTPVGQTPSPTPTPTPVGQTPSPTPTPTPVGQTPSPTPIATPTPTEVPGESVFWGDANCSGEADPVDSLLTLRFDAGLSTNTGNCPAIGQVVGVQNASLHPWGDVDCGGEVTPVDSLKLLRYDAGLSVTTAQGCPQMGSSVTIVIP